MATPSFTTKFVTSIVNSEKFILTDNTNWVGQGIALTSVNGNFKITAPSGTVIYDNNTSSVDTADYSDANADIYNQNAVRTNRAVATPTISLPLDPLTGVAELGTYIIYYKVYDSVALDFYEVTNTYVNTYVRPTIVITPYVNVLSAVVRITDSTDYTVGGINPTLTSISAAFRMLPPPEEDGTPRSAVTATYTIIGGVMTLDYPDVAIGETNASIVSTIAYTLTDGLIINDIIRGGEIITVNAADFCSIICGLKNLQTRALACCSTGLFSKDAATYYMVTSLMVEVDNQVRCGVDVDVSATVALIKTLVPCEGGCNECGDTGSIVIPVGSILNNVVCAMLDGTVTISTVVAGTTTTYTFSVSAAVMTLINNATTNIAALTVDIGLLQIQVAELLAKEFEVVSTDGTIDVTNAFTLAGATVSNTGIGYTALDVLDVVGGTNTIVAQITIHTVDGFGSILTYGVTQVGAYTVIPTNPAATTYGGGGLLAEFNLEWSDVVDLSYTAKLAGANANAVDVSSVDLYDLFAGGATITGGDGQYLIYFTADFLMGLGSTGTILGTYYPVKNAVLGTNISIYAPNVDTLQPPDSASLTAFVTKMAGVYIASLTDGDVISMALDITATNSSGLQQVDNATIAIIRVA